MLSGEPFAIAGGIAFDPNNGVAAVSTAPIGTLAFRAGGAIGERQLTRYDRSGRALGTVGPLDTTSLLNPEIAPDGRTVVVNRLIETAQDIWQIDTSRGVPTRLTFDPASDRIGVFSANGEEVFFSSSRNGGVWNVYARPLRGGSSERLLHTSALNKFAMGASRDGRYLLLRTTNANTNWDLWALPLDGRGQPLAVATSTYQESIAEFSPDGRWVAYQTNESGVHEIVVQSFPDPGVRVQISSGGGSQPRWRRDGGELFYIALDGRLHAVTIAKDGKGGLTAERPAPLFATQTPGGPVPTPQKQQYAVDADGTFLINSLTDKALSSPVTLILNWRAQPRR